jgi:hypothetical protein
MVLGFLGTVGQLIDEFVRLSHDAPFRREVMETRWRLLSGC